MTFVIYCKTKTEAPNDVLQEVCPHCATTFPSRSSTMKIVTSKVSLSNQQANVVNNQANDAVKSFQYNILQIHFTLQLPLLFVSMIAALFRKKFIKFSCEF